MQHRARKGTQHMPGRHSPDAKRCHQLISLTPSIVPLGKNSRLFPLSFLIPFGIQMDTRDPCAHSLECDEFIIGGIRTNIPLHQALLADPDVNAGRISTRTIERLVTRGF